mmetsp:Transcript_31179/g.37722  ORF Transcript_31179/g.37722 Transcript_31179/m.37722 type:complete len:149 (-) Transcript_31179:603-1049(-)
MQHAADGYTVPVMRADTEDAFFALEFEDAPLEMAHGGPRIVFPDLYGWKSAKWLCRLELMSEYAPGFWETLGCHRRGRVELEERFEAGWKLWVWRCLAAAPGLYRRIFGYDVWVWVMQTGGQALGSIVERWLPWLHDARKMRPSGITT